MSHPRRLRSSTKLAIGFALVVALGYGLYTYGGQYLVDKEEYTPLEPGEVNLLGVNAGSGFRIIVANQLAHLVEGGGSEDFETPDRNESGFSSGEKKRIPVRDMLQALRGDEKALGKFVTHMNDELKVDLPAAAETVTWTPEQIKAACSGDATLKKKLERQLNTNLDGTAPDYLSITAMQTGIILKCPIEMEVPRNGKPTIVRSFVDIPYRTNFARKLEGVIGEKTDDTNFVRGAYIEERKSLGGNKRNQEDVRKALLDRIDPTNLRRYTEAPERVVRQAHVVLNDSFIEKASYRKRTLPNNEEVYDILITVNEEGRKRLWQYSRRNKGTQLLLVSKGIPIAAPRITGDLAQSDVTITQLEDPTLVEDTVSAINTAVKQPTR